MGLKTLWSFVVSFSEDWNTLMYEIIIPQNANRMCICRCTHHCRTIHSPNHVHAHSTIVHIDIHSEVDSGHSLHRNDRDLVSCRILCKQRLHHRQRGLVFASVISMFFSILLVITQHLSNLESKPSFCRKALRQGNWTGD